MRNVAVGRGPPLPSDNGFLIWRGVGGAEPDAAERDAAERMPPSGWRGALPKRWAAMRDANRDTVDLAGFRVGARRDGQAAPLAAHVEPARERTTRRKNAVNDLKGATRQAHQHLAGRQAHETAAELRHEGGIAVHDPLAGPVEQRHGLLRPGRRRSRRVSHSR